MVMYDIILSFMLSIAAGVMANYISKWLDGKKDKGNQPKE